MCPSYMVTKEEMDSTRGRAHLLFEMLQGDPMKEGWKSEAVKEALDLCLACKGCKSDCPMNVDMATYKAEFLSHYYEGRLRPRHAYAMGWIYWWARLASLAAGSGQLRRPDAGPRQDRPSGSAASRPSATMPAVRPGDLQGAGSAGGRRGTSGRPRVILWPDTFNNHFHPADGQGGRRGAGGRRLPGRGPAASLCCGRPLYDFGMLDTAKGLLREILDTLAAGDRGEHPVVGLEPSCVAVFRDELIEPLPRRTRTPSGSATSTFILSEFLEQEGAGLSAAAAQAQGPGAGHCHHKHVMKFDDENAVLKKLGLDYELLDSGCCGMAGSFGFESGGTTTSRSPSASAVCCRPCARTTRIR